MCFFVFFVLFKTVGASCQDSHIQSTVYLICIFFINIMITSFVVKNILLSVCMFTYVPLQLPSWPLTYPLPSGLFEDDIPAFVRAGYVIVPGRVFSVSYRVFQGLSHCLAGSI